MATFSLREFRTQVSTRGLAKPTRFEVLIGVPRILRQDFGGQNRIVSLFCESAAFPPHIIGVRPQRIYGPPYQRPFSVEYGGEGVTLNFLLDQQMDVKAFFDIWMSRIVHPHYYYVEYPEDYTVDIEINQLDERNNFTYGVFLEEAFPRTLTLLELNHQNQNQAHKLSVTFAYRRWLPKHSLYSRLNLTPRRITTEDESYGESRRLQAKSAVSVPIPTGDQGE